MEEDESLWKSSMIIIGRKDKVDFLELGLYDVDANEAGASKVRFRLLDPSRPSYNNREFTHSIYAKREIKNSFGQVEERYIIKTKILLFDELFDIELSLTDRSRMVYPVLLGRKLLFNHFIVDVTQTDLSYNQKLRRMER